MFSGHPGSERCFSPPSCPSHHLRSRGWRRCNSHCTSPFVPCRACAGTRRVMLWCPCPQTTVTPPGRAGQPRASPSPNPSPGTVLSRAAGARGASGTRPLPRPRCPRTALPTPGAAPAPLQERPAGLLRVPSCPAWGEAGQAVPRAGTAGTAGTAGPCVPRTALLSHPPRLEAAPGPVGTGGAARGWALT